MLLTTLTAATAVFVGLWLTNTEVNISAMMGMTMVIGIVTEVEISTSPSTRPWRSRAAQMNGTSWRA